MKTKSNDKRDQQADNKSNQSVKPETAKKDGNSKVLSANTDKKSTPFEHSKAK
jgi:hypothetical protein